MNERTKKDLPQQTGKSRPRFGIETAPSSLPRGVGQNKFESAQVPADFGKGLQSLGSAARDIGESNSVGERLPGMVEGHETPTGGFGSRSGAADYANGVNNRGKIGSAKEEFAGLMFEGPKTGSGATRQGQDKEEITFEPDEVDNIVSTMKEKAKNAAKSAVDKATSAAKAESDFTDAFLGSIGNEKDKNGKLINHDNDEDKTSDKPKPGPFDKWDRVADDGPGEENPDGKHLNPDRVKDAVSGDPGIRFIPGEEAGGEAGITPGNFQDLGPVQVHTIEGALPQSDNLKDFSKKIQDTVKAGGPNIVEQK